MTEEVKRQTMIVTGASQGIGAGVTKAFIKRGYNVVANSRKMTESEFEPTDRLVLVDGNIGEVATAEKIAAAAMETFGSPETNLVAWSTATGSCHRNPRYWATRGTGTHTRSSGGSWRAGSRSSSFPTGPQSQWDCRWNR